MSIQRQLTLIIWVVLSVVLWFAVSYGLFMRTDHRLRRELLVQTQMSSKVVSQQHLLRLTGEAADRLLPAYQRIEERLSEALQSMPQSRFMYLMGRRQNGDIFFILDVAQERAGGSLASPGEVYAEASAELKAAFSDGRQFTEGPLTDEWGNWISAFVPIADQENGQILAYLGVDVDARDWPKRVLVESALPSFFFLMLLVVFWVVGVAWKLHARAMRKIYSTLDVRDSSWLSRDQFSLWTLRRLIWFVPMLLLLGLGLDYAIRHHAVIPRFLRMEEQFARKAILGCVESLCEECGQLGIAAQSWGYWSETADFVQGMAPAFEETHLDWAMLEKSHIELVSIRDARGRPVWQGALDTETKQPSSVPVLPFEEHLDHLGVRHSEGAGLMHSGLVMVQDTPMLIAGAAITPHRKGAEPVGHLWIGRYVSPPMLLRIARQSGINELQIVNPHSPYVSAVEQHMLAQLSPGEILLDTSEADTLRGYLTMADSEGHPMVLLTAHMHRSLVQEGMRIAKLFSTLTLLALFALGGGLLAWSLSSTSAVLRRQSHIEKMVQRRTEELRQAEARFRTMIENLPGGILGVDGETQRNMFANETFCRMLGMTREDVLARGVSDLHPPDAFPRVLQAYGRMVQGKQAVALDVPVLRKDGSTFLTDVHVSWVTLEGRQYVLGIFSDISERKQIEAELLAERNLFAAGPVLTIVWDPSPGWPVRRVSSNVSSILGFTRDEMLDPAFRYDDIIHSDDLEQLRRLMPKRQQRGQNAFEDSYRIRVKSGEYRWIYGFTTLQYGADGHLQEIRGYIFDQTLLKEYELRLREHRRRLESILETSLVGTWEWDMESGRLHVNQRWAAISGYTVEELAPLDQAVWDEMTHPEDGAVAKALLQRLFAGELDFYECELRIRHKEGHWVWVIDRGKVTEWTENRRPKQMQGIRQDVTLRKQAVEEQQTLRDRLHQAQRMEAIGQLAGGVAHDFNNMLGVILGFTELSLEEVPLHSPLHANLLEIQKAAARSAELTRELLAFARRQTVTPQILDFNASVSNMLERLRGILGSGVSLSWQPDPLSGSVRMDPEQLQQILENLCENAREAMSGSGRMVMAARQVAFSKDYCRVHTDYQPGEFIHLTVSDTGAGMSEEQAGRIFEPFYTTKEMSEGAGLGLATVYGIIRQNNGFIHLDSRPGAGTDFHIFLPRFTTDGEASAETPGAADSDAAAPAAPPAPSGLGESILLVEDDPPLLSMVSLLLQREGYAVHPLLSSQEALRMVQDTTIPIDLLLTDVIMPDMNGRDLSRQIEAARPGLKCLFMSGYTADVIASHGVLDTDVHFIQKPFSGQELLAKVRGILDGGEA